MTDVKLGTGTEMITTLVDEAFRQVGWGKFWYKLILQFYRTTWGQHGPKGDLNHFIIGGYMKPWEFGHDDFHRGISPKWVGKILV